MNRFEENKFYCFRGMDSHRRFTNKVDINILIAKYLTQKPFQVTKVDDVGNVVRIKAFGRDEDTDITTICRNSGHVALFCRYIVGANELGYFIEVEVDSTENKETENKEDYFVIVNSSIHRSEVSYDRAVAYSKDFLDKAADDVEVIILKGISRMSSKTTKEIIKSDF
ncbi:hypothetical protein NCTGTJJY_CDS0227 [Serratia phage 92A1]|nr:hypothetical protein NCTGTJJY_CDS0227 [Serratia phage 92A1]